MIEPYTKGKLHEFAATIAIGVMFSAIPICVGIGVLKSGCFGGLIGLGAGILIMTIDYGVMEFFFGEKHEKDQ